MSGFSKIFEKTTVVQLKAFLEYENLINRSQYGFRKQFSFWGSNGWTWMGIYNVSGALDGSHRAVGVLCDLTKPFDTVDHAILFGELEKLGIKGIKCVCIGHI